MTQDDIEHVRADIRSDMTTVLGWRIGAVEKLAEKNEEAIAQLTQSLDKLSAEMREFIAAMPYNYILRSEHEAAKSRGFAIRTQWPLVIFAGVNMLIAVSTFLVTVLVILPHAH